MAEDTEFEIGGWSLDSRYFSYSNRNGCFIFDADKLAVKEVQVRGKAVNIFNSDSFLFFDKERKIISCVSPTGQLLSQLEYNKPHVFYRAFAIDSLTFLLTSDRLNEFNHGLSWHLLGVDFRNYSVVELCKSIGDAFVIDFELEPTTDRSEIDAE